MKSEAYIPRNPRHETSVGSSFAIKVERSATNETVACRLTNVSRNGFQGVAATAFERGEEVTVMLDFEKIGFTRPMAASVRWGEQLPSGDHATGFLFNETIPLEVLGELILLGVIDGASRKA